WFGIYGAIASYIGLVVAGSLGGWFPIPNGLVLGLSDLVLALSVAVAVRWFRLDPEIPNARHAFGFVLASLVGSVIGSLWYNTMNLYVFKILGGDSSFWAAVIGWNVGNLIVIVVIGLLLVKYVNKA